MDEDYLNYWVYYFVRLDANLNFLLQNVLLLIHYMKV